MEGIYNACKRTTLSSGYNKNTWFHGTGLNLDLRNIHSLKVGEGLIKLVDDRFDSCCLLIFPDILLLEPNDC